MRKRMWSPEWSGVIELWTRKFIYENRWRYDSIHEPEDLLQDAYLVFMKIKRMYPRVIEAPHFMSLYKTALRNQMLDQASYAMRKRAVHVETPLDVSEMYSHHSGDLSHEGNLRILLSEAPEEVQAALLALETKADTVRQEPSKTGRLRKRENLNQRLRRAAGIDNGFDVVGSLKQLLAKG